MTEIHVYCTVFFLSVCDSNFSKIQMPHLKIRFQKTCPLITLIKGLKILKFRYNETSVKIFLFLAFKDIRCTLGLKFFTNPLSIPSLIALLSALNNSVLFSLVFDVMDFDGFG